MFNIKTKPHELDRNMRSQLADSLDHIFDRNKDILFVSNKQINTMLDTIRSNRVDPGAFARYFELVFSLESNKFDLARKLTVELTSVVQEDINFKILAFSKEALGKNYERYPQLLFASYSDDCPMASPESALFESHYQKILEAMEIVQKIDPSIGEEVDELISRIIVAISSKNKTDSRGFGGVSSFMLWGAIFINANNYFTVSQVVEFLVHEVTHTVLFGYSAENPLVLNNASEDYPSPLRDDLRPMDGIYHATLVSARIALFVRQWVDSGHINFSDIDWAEQTFKNNCNAFVDGLIVVRNHGQLSVLAWDLLKRAESRLQVYV